MSLFLIFVVGSQSTLINDFIIWLHENGVIVLNDRLFSIGRSDILQTPVDVNELEKTEDNIIRLERKKYQQKVKSLMKIDESMATFVDCIFINPLHVAMIKRYFPNAKIILLTRETEEIWFNQKVFGEEQLTSNQWNDAKNKILSMNFNLLNVNIDKWLANDKETLNQINEKFELDFNPIKPVKTNYWQRTNFEKGHWKNYEKYLT